MPEARDRPVVELELVSDSIAVATLHGEHDLSTAREVATGLDRACEKVDVIVDLSHCAFLDSTVIARRARLCSPVCMSRRWMGNNHPWLSPIAGSSRRRHWPWTNYGVHAS
jgi:hypothetical protein